MKFLALFLATVAFASASLVGGKYIDVKDGALYIKSEDGNQIQIIKHIGPFGERRINIEVTGPNGFNKLYQMGSNKKVNYGNDFTTQMLNINNKYQDDNIIDVIFEEYLGQVNEYTYQQLLKKVEKAVLNGDLDEKFLYILKAFVENNKWFNLISGQTLYGQNTGLWNEMTEQNKYGLGFFGKLYKKQNVYNQDYNQYYNNILMRIFDKKVLKNILVEQQMYNQEMYGQYSHENMWDMVFSHEGVYDYHYLVEIINNEVLRTWFVEHGFFNKVVLDQILYTYQTEGTFNQYLLERLWNTQLLKYFFVKRGFSVYDILRQTSYNQYYGNTFYNKDIYGYNVLENMISQPTLRNAMVQYGIFYKNILDQILYRYTAQGVYDQILLKQLVNKQALYKVLVQYGIDETVLRQFVDNEYLGLNFLFKNNFFQQTPRMTYNNVFGVDGNIPEYTKYMYRGNNLKSYIRGQQYSGYTNGPSRYGKSLYPYTFTQQVY